MLVELTFVVVSDSIGTHVIAKFLILMLREDVFGKIGFKYANMTLMYARLLKITSQLCSMVRCACIRIWTYNSSNLSCGYKMVVVAITSTYFANLFFLSSTNSSC